MSPGARDQLRARRRTEFATQHVVPLLTEAAKLDISGPGLTAMIERGRDRA